LVDEVGIVAEPSVIDQKIQAAGQGFGSFPKSLAKRGVREVAG
jgi:hypothetical protein